MNKLLLCLTALPILLIGCESEEKQDPFLWDEGQIGYITPETKVYQLDSLYVNDSIVNPVQGDGFATGPGKIEVYESNGRHLLTLTPSEPNDSTSTIRSVLIRDKRYKTPEGISIESDFGQISKAYEVSSVDRMMNQAMVRLKNQDFYFTVGLEELPGEIQFDLDKEIDQTQIPDSSKPKYVFISW